MPQTCTVCRHANLADIDGAILRRDSLRDIARQYSISKDAVARHKADHLPKTLVKAKAAQELVRADSLLDYVQRRQTRLERLDDDAREIQQTSMRENDRSGALDAIKVRTGIAREQRGFAELLGRLTGELDAAAVQPNITIVNILSVPKVSDLRSALPMAETSSTGRV